MFRTIVPSVAVFFAGLYISLFTINAYYDSIDNAGTMAISRIAPAAGNIETDVFNGFDGTFVREEEEESLNTKEEGPDAE